MDSSKETFEEVVTLETTGECLAVDFRATVEAAVVTSEVDLTISISVACPNKCQEEAVVDSSTLVALAEEAST